MTTETTNRTTEQAEMTANRDESARRLQECVTEARSALNEVSQIKTELDSLSGRCALAENRLAKSIAAIVIISTSPM